MTNLIPLKADHIPKYLKFIAYKDFHLWDVKRYYKQNKLQFNNVVMLCDILIPYKKNVSKQEMKENKWQIISKISIKGELFLRNFEEINTYKGSLRLVPDNSIIYSKIGVKQGSIYFHEKRKTPFGVSSEYPAYTFNDNKVNGKFLHRLLRSNCFKQLLGNKTTGISRSRVSQGEFLSLQIPLPTLAEQNKIINNYYEKIHNAKELEQQAQQLENEIEAYFLAELGIEKQQKRERIKGLQFVEFATLEKWGVDFAHNSIKAKQTYEEFTINQFCKISSGGTPSRSRKDFYENGYIPWIKTGELSNNILTNTEEKITKEALENSSAKLYKKGSLIIAMYGATIGRTAKLGIDATTNQACAVLFDIDNSKILTNYLWEYLQVKTEHLKALAYGSAQPNLNAGIIANYPIPLPPLSKQQEIVAVIQAKKEQIKEIKTQSQTLKHQAETEFEETVFGNNE